MIVDPLHDEMFRMTTNAGQNRLEVRVGFVDRPNGSGAQFRPFHLGHPFFSRSSGNLTPRRTCVVQVPVVKSEGETGADCGGLTKNGEPFLAIALDPTEATTMNFGVVTGRHHCLPKDRPTRFGG